MHFKHFFIFILNTTTTPEHDRLKIFGKKMLINV